MRINQSVLILKWHDSVWHRLSRMSRSNDFNQIRALIPTVQVKYKYPFLAMVARIPASLLSREKIEKADSFPFKLPVPCSQEISVFPQGWSILLHFHCHSHFFRALSKVLFRQSSFSIYCLPPLSSFSFDYNIC